MNGDIRFATRRELAEWQKVLDASEKIHGRMVAAQLKNANAQFAYQWGLQRNQPITDPKNLEVELLKIQGDYSLLRDVISQVENRQLALSFVNGKIDIVQYKPIVEQGPTMSGWVIPVLIAVGAAIAVVPDIMDRVFKNLTRQAELINELDRWKKASEKTFCELGSPEICAEWKQYVAESGYQQRDEESDGILDRIGKGVKTGLQWGVGAAVAIVGVVLAMSFRK